jgi:hypothetical protein
MGVRTAILTAIAVSVMATASLAQTQENLTITTYYPSPYGVYKSLRLMPGNKPVAGVAAGVMFYNSSDNQIYYYDNTDFKIPGSTGGGLFWQANNTGLYLYNMTTSQVRINAPTNLTNITGKIIAYNATGDAVYYSSSNSQVGGGGCCKYYGAIHLLDTKDASRNYWGLCFENEDDGDYSDNSFLIQREEIDWTHNVIFRINSSNGFVSIDNATNTYKGLQPRYNLHVNGTFAATIKNFEIPDPINPKKRLVHSTIEGLEYAVFYRGKAKLANGRAEIVLPAYFEALTRKEGRTVLFTPVGGYAALYLDGEIKNGRFAVRSSFAEQNARELYWEVKAVRADTPALVAER